MAPSKSSKSSIDHRDVYYRLGKSAGYRARSAYKLLHLDEEFDLFTGVETAVDLCAAPGSWSQVLSQRLKPSSSENGRKIVSIDLQPMARLPNITILQTDITLPSTIPLVLDALGGRKADLVVCDGAPDVTGVHDLDAYLHSQLLLAALTLSLTLLAPHSTLIFKIFLSPLDPQAALLASQLRCFFPGPKGSDDTYEEFDVPDETNAEAADGDTREPMDATSSQAGQEGYDTRGRRGGVWVRKPRSSRKGSGEAFIVCRNFDPSRVPLPQTFSPAALAELRQQTSGTLTLDSLASLGDGHGLNSKEWESIKGYVGGGDLNPIGGLPTPHKPTRAKAPPITFEQAPKSPADRHEQLSTSPKALFAHPTPLEGPPEYFSPKASPGSPSPSRRTIAPPTLLSPERLHLDTRRLAGPAARAAALAYGSGDVGEGSSRQSSLDSLTPNPSPIHLSDPTRPWASSSHIPAPSPQTNSAQLNVPGPSTSNRDRSSSNASVFSTSSAREDHLSATTPLVSPALSSSSKTDLFFASSVKDLLPVPPRALPNSAKLGRGLLSTISKTEDRSTSMPSINRSQVERQERTPLWGENSTPGPSSGIASGSVDLTSPFPSNQGYTSYSGLPPQEDLSRRFGFEEITSTSRLRSVSNPMATVSSSSSPNNNYSPATSRFMKGHGTLNEPLATLPTLPDVNDYTTPTKSQKRPAIAGHGRRESQILEREHSQAKEDINIKAGEIIRPEDTEGDLKSTRRAWRLERKLGEGAFSAVWSASPLPPESASANADNKDTPRGSVAALKLMDRQLSLQDSRTRISFLREVEVLRHISHPSIVSYLDSFTTPTHHVLVLEQLEGGELFDLMSDENNRRRMILPSPRPDPDASSEGERGKWDESGEGFVRRVFGELTRAVGWLHEVGVVHRDIKLENILFTINPFTLPPTSTNSIPLHLLPSAGPLIKLTDFGLSRFISTSSPLLQTRCGSESFAAPEIIMGKPYDGRETDSWAMGVVLYGLIIGELPFDRDLDDLSKSNSNANSNSTSNRPGTPLFELDQKAKGRKRMMRIAKCEYSFPTAATESGTKEVQNVISKLLIRDPKKRLKVNELWDQEWMQSDLPGGVPRPPLQTPTPTTTTTASPNVEQGGDHSVNDKSSSTSSLPLNPNPSLPSISMASSRRKVLDGFLVEEDGIEEVARAEH
ncbi:uncharacterized protein I303_100685 [Kwoniella dejecticola CBS 10117]|uniref:Protein kinase domain-containing protein n=1 Tax=Kwoniella dejecticola CBS 10117 TaxID=1296121 RepID=A0AAJ8KII4_9TREE